VAWEAPEVGEWGVGSGLAATWVALLFSVDDSQAKP